MVQFYDLPKRSIDSCPKVKIRLPSANSSSCTNCEQQNLGAHYSTVLSHIPRCSLTVAGSTGILARLPRQSSKCGTGHRQQVSYATTGIYPTVFIYISTLLQHSTLK